jgi:hypothetical protein
MRGRLFLLLAILGAGLSVQACGHSGSATTNVTAPTGERCAAVVTNSSSSFEAGGGTGTVSVAVARECGWNAASQSSWVSITSAAEGQGNGTVNYTVAANADPVTRQGALLVSDRRLALTQAASPCRFEVAAPSTGVGPEGGELIIQIRTHPSCDWSARSDVPWANLVPGAGRGDAAIRVVVQPNTGTERQIAVIVAGERVTAMQRAAAPGPTPPAPTPTPPAPPPAPPGPTPGPTPPTPTPTPTPAPPSPTPTPPSPTPTPAPAPLKLVTEPSTMPIGYEGERFPGLRVRAQGGKGPYKITGTNLLGWPSSLDYNVDPVAGTADWQGTVTRVGEFPVRMVVEDSLGARSELMLTFVFKEPPDAKPLKVVTEPRTMPIGYEGQRFPGITVRAQGGKGPYKITGTNLLGWPSSLDYSVDEKAGTAEWSGTVTRTGEFPVRMVVEDSKGARGELTLIFVFRPAPTLVESSELRR